MTRRVRSDMRVQFSDMAPRGSRWPGWIVIEYPRIVSRCANRADIWEWRQSRAVEL